MTINPHQAYVRDPFNGDSAGLAVHTNFIELPFGILATIDVAGNTRFYPWSSVIYLDNPVSLPVTPVSISGLPNPLPVSLPTATMATGNAAVKVNVITGLL